MRRVREIDPEHPGDGGRPRARGVHDSVRANGLLVEGRRGTGPRAGHDAWAHAHAIDSCAGRFEADDFVPSGDLDAQLAGCLRITPYKWPRKDDAVVRVVARHLDRPRVELRHDATRLRCREQARRQATFVLQCDTLLETFPRGARAREKEVSALAKPDVNFHFRSELATHANALEHQPHVGLARPLRSHATSIAPACAAAKIRAIDDRHVGEALLGEVIRHREPHDPGADHDDVRAISHTVRITESAKRATGT